MRKVVRVRGVNSNLRDGDHCIMMDCEDCSLRQIVNEVARLQNFWQLGPADIFSTGDSDHWHVYIWTRMEWRRCLQVMLNCVYEDYKHVMFSMKRRHATLRLSDKGGHSVGYCISITSIYPATCSNKELVSFTEYQTGMKE